MRILLLLAPSLILASCGGTSIENSSDAANHQVNAINANLSEDAGRNPDAEVLAPVMGQRGLKRQEPPRDSKIQ